MTDPYDFDRYRVAVLGANGRMGRAVIRLLSEHPRLRLGAAIERSAFTKTIAERTVLIEEINTCDAVIDFSSVNALDDLMRISAIKVLPIITGVTGYDEASLACLHSLAKDRPLFHASNFSIGVALLERLTEQASRLLGDDFDVEIFELHHRQKVDAPSGTALTLAQAAAKGREGDVSDQPRYPRDSKLVQVSAGRGGQVIGDHTVFFLGEEERIELTHRADHRDLFARGALRATEWCLKQPPGLYKMNDLWEP